MAAWLNNISGKFKKFTDSLGGKPLEEALPEMLDAGDPRVAIRPLGNDWLCPFTGTRIEAPDWNGSSKTLLMSATIKQYLLNQPELQKQGAKAPMKSYEDLVSITTLARLSGSQNFKFAVPTGEWVCPYCMQKTELLMRNWDGSEADPKWFVPQALDHLKKCAAYQQDPINGARALDQLATAGGDRSKVVQLVMTDPRFHLCDDTGAWLCPYSARTISYLNLRKERWGADLQQRIVDYIMSPDCPAKYSQFNVERSLEDLIATSKTKPALL